MALGCRFLAVLIFARRLLAGATAAYVTVVLTLGGMAPARLVFYGLTTAWTLFLALQTYWSHQRSKRVLCAPGTSNARPTLRVIEIAAFNVALTLLLGEIALRAFAAWSGCTLVVNAAEEGYRLAPGQDYGAGLRGNCLGYPGPEFQHDKPPGVYRIAALGDSFAVGPVVPFAANYLTLLEKQLPHGEVYNFGVAGTGPREYRNILRRDVWKYQPDLVLTSIFVGNDITETLATPRHLEPRQHALYLLCQRSWRWLWDRRHQERPPPGLANRCTTPTLSPHTFRAVEARRLAVCVQPPSPAMEKKWQRALAFLDDIVKDCRQHGVPLAVVLIPDEFQVNPAVFDHALVDAGVDRAAVDLRLPQQRLGTFFVDRGVPCLDLLPAFVGVRDTYAPCDTHWNVRGNRLAAEQLGAWLLRQSLVRALRTPAQKGSDPLNAGGPTPFGQAFLSARPGMKSCQAKPTGSVGEAANSRWRIRRCRVVPAWERLLQWASSGRISRTSP